MTITIAMSFEDDAGAWHDFVTVPDHAVEMDAAGGPIEYRIRRQDETSELGELIEMMGTRCWQFKWLNAGQPTGLAVIRKMMVDTIESGQLVLRTPDHATGVIVR